MGSICCAAPSCAWKTTRSMPWRAACWAKARPSKAMPGLECRRSRMTPDRVAASIASFDFVYLSELEKRGIVAPTVRSSDSSVHAAQQGGHVLESASGLHRNVWVFDFKSLYPSLIRTFNIDPLSYVPDPAASDDLIR